MGPAALIVLMIAAAATIMVLAWSLSPGMRTRRALRKVPRRSIGDARDGAPTKIVGRLALTAEPLVAPLTGRPCACFEVTVEELRSSGKSSHWHTVIHEVGLRDFILDDGTGKALVRVQPDPKLAIVLDAHFRSGTFNDATPELEAFLSRHGRSSHGWLFNKSIRYREGVLEAGEQVAALGVGRWEVDPDPSPGSEWGGYRDAPRRLVVTAGAELAVHVSDEPSTLT